MKKNLILLLCVSYTLLLMGCFRSTPILLSIENLPEYEGQPYVCINNNEPNFNESELTTEAYESYSALDFLGRGQSAMACIGIELMPTQERGQIGMIKPSGWHTIKYDIVEGNYLYNRCHLIAYQLAGENANENNLITGTRYLNVSGMLPFENLVANYVRETGNHVMYRVTPIYEGNNLLSNGVQMEGYSVEDAGKGVSFHVFIYNVQPGIWIDYATGASELEEEYGNQTTQEPEGKGEVRYILNTNTLKIHLPICSSIDDMKEHNKKKFKGTLEEAEKEGYTACKRCNPR